MENKLSKSNQSKAHQQTKTQQNWTRDVNDAANTVIDDAHYSNRFVCGIAQLSNTLAASSMRMVCSLVFSNPIFFSIQRARLV